MNNPMIEMETRLAFLDDLVQSLDATVVAQDRRLFLLEQALAELKQRVLEVPAGEAIDDDAPPPHY